jgi:hypothetical protein
VTEVRRGVVAMQIWRWLVMSHEELRKLKITLDEKSGNYTIPPELLKLDMYVVRGRKYDDGYKS